MMLDLVLYGPSERILNSAEDERLFLEYLKEARKCKYIASICYVGSTSLPEKYHRYFDMVDLTYSYNIFDEKYQGYEKVTNYNFGYHIVNLKKSHEIAKTMEVIVHRVDIIPCDITQLVQIFMISKKKFLIDSALNHTKILPFYLSDFFYIGPRIDINLADLTFQKGAERKLILNPFNKLSAGKFNVSHMYPEYIIWRYFFQLNLSKDTNDPNGHSFIDVVKFWNACSQIKFISRNANFHSAGKLKGKGSEKWGHEINMLTITYSLFLFLRRTIEVIKNKLKRYI